MEIRRIISVLFVISVLAASLAGFTACGSVNKNTVDPEKSEEPETLSEWDSAQRIWVPDTELDFELRVRPDYEYESVPDEDNLGCTFRTDDGKEIHILVQGMDYENTFDQLIGYFKSTSPESLSAGKESQTVIVKHSSDETEICSKITDMLCLTTRAKDSRAAEEFFSRVMIRVEGEDYIPLDPDEDFDVIELD